MEVRKFSMKEALALLDIKPPKISRDMSQRDIDKLVSEWKENELAARFKEKRREAHPDKPNGDEELFKDLTVAFEEVKKHLKLRKPVVPPSKVARCRRCKADRVPADATHCHDCGVRYRLDSTRVACPTCAAERQPSNAKFCHRCGYDYQVFDALIERMLAMGFREKDIAKLEEWGTLKRWRSVPATSPHLQAAMEKELSNMSWDAKLDALKGKF